MSAMFPKLVLFNIPKTAPKFKTELFANIGPLICLRVILIGKALKGPVLWGICTRQIYLTYRLISTHPATGSSFTSLQT